MWLIRVLFVLVLLWLIATALGWLIRRAFIRQIKKFQHQMASQQDSAQKNEHSLIQCAQCGTYIEEQQAIHREGNVYCCKEHAL